MPSSQLFNNPSRSLRIAAWAAVMLCLHAPLQASSTSTSTPKHAAKAAPISVIGPVTRSVGTGETMGCEKVSLDAADVRSEEHTSELQSQSNLVCRLLLEKKKSNHK